MGFSDVDPFVLSLRAGHTQVSEAAILTVILNVSERNNLLKADCSLSRANAMWPKAAGLVLPQLLSLTRCLFP